MSAIITSLEQLHAVELEALQEIDRVCRLHGIRWFLHGGTLLGALRHGGPIPWDDDVDIAFLRADYERFRAEAVPSLNPRFVFTDHAEDAEFFDFVPRITDTAYTYASSSEYASRFQERHDHPDVDLFVFDPACEGVRDALQSLLLMVNTAQALGHRAAVNHDDFHGAAKLASYVLPALGKRKSVGRLLQGRLRLASWGAPDAPVLRVVNDIPESMGFRFERAWYEGERRVVFSGVELPVPRGAEAELDEVYHGTWRTLPPVEARRPRHAALAYDPAVGGR